jgi:putative membrane protein
MNITAYDCFLLVKAWHIISVIAWMAALLYLPRLFVYHSLHQDQVELSKVFLLMEKRLIRIIMTPGLISTILTGLFLLHSMPDYITFYWMQLKLFLVFLLSIVHCYFIHLYKTFVAGVNTKNDKFFRIINEIPTIIMVVIVILVVLKP